MKEYVLPSIASLIHLTVPYFAVTIQRLGYSPNNVIK